MEKVDVEHMVADKDTGNERIWEVINWHCMIVKFQGFIDVELIFSNLLISPFIFSKGSQLENSVIEISDCEDLAIVALLNLSELDVAFWIASKFLLKADYEGLQAELLDPVLPIGVLLDGDGTLRVVTDHAVDQWVLGDNVLTPCQPTEHIVEVSKTLVWLHILVRVGAQSKLLLFHLNHCFVTVNFLLELRFLFSQIG